MDGISAVASVAGVVSLAMQISSATHTLVKFLGTISDAPKEVVRLKDMLNLVHIASVGVKKALEYQARLHGDNIEGIQSIHDVLEVCQKKLSLIQSVLDRVENIERGRNLVSRSWARFRLAVKKEDIVDFEKQLGHALGVLNVQLSTNLMYSNTRNTLVILEKVENQNLTRGSSQLAAIQKHQNSVQVVDMLSTATINAQDIVATTSDLFQAQSWRTISSTTKVISWEKYHCGIGLISVSTEKKRRTQQNGNGLQFVTQTVSTKCRISPRFLSWSLEFMVSRWNQWTPTFGLTIEHQISWEVYEQRLRPLFESDDVPALQELLCRGECNLDSLIQDSWSLVEKAQDYGARNIVLFLIVQGCKVEPKIAWCSLLEHKNASAEVISAQFQHICDRTDLSEYTLGHLIPRNYWGCYAESCAAVSAIEYLSVAGLRKSILPAVENLSSLLYALCRVWGQTEQLQQKRDEILKTLVKWGANIHLVDQDGMSLLQILIRDSYRQDATAIVSHWLQILQSCGVVVDDYLCQEKLLCLTPIEPKIYSWTFQSVKPRKVDISYQASGYQDVAVTRWTDPESPAAILFGEFDFSPDLEICSGYYCGDIEPLIDLWRNTPWNYPYDAGRKSFSDFLEEWLVDQIKSQERSVEDAVCDKGSHEGKLYIEQDLVAEDELTTLVEIVLKQPKGVCQCDSYGNYIELWPFSGNTHTLCQSGSMLGKECCNGQDGSPRWCSYHKCCFNHARFERKKAKKLAKGRRAQGIKPVKTVMPGAWVD